MRQVVGYDHLVGEHAYRQLTELYRALRLYVNCFQPSMKLLSKERDGKKIRCVYDPAKTSLQRLLLSGVLPLQKQQELTEVAQALDPVRILHQLELLQQAVFRCAAGCSPFVSSPLSEPLHVFSVEQCTAGKLPEKRNATAPTAGFETLYREQERRKRVLGWRRTHKDPFEGGMGADLPLASGQSRAKQWRHFPGAAAPLPRKLSALTNPHPRAEGCARSGPIRHGNQGGAVVGRSDPGTILLAIFREMLCQHTLAALE